MTTRRSLFSIVAGMFAAVSVPTIIEAKPNAWREALDSGIFGSYPTFKIYEGTCLSPSVEKWWPLSAYTKFKEIPLLQRGSIRTVTVSQWMPENGPVTVDNIVSEQLLWNGDRWIDGDSNEALDIWREMFISWGETWAPRDGDRVRRQRTNKPS